MKKKDVISKEIDLTKFLNSTDMIDLGEFALRKNLDNTWDFYLNENGKCMIRYTYETFQPIKMVDDAIYVLKRVGKYRVKYAIYSSSGEKRVDFSDTIRECGSRILVEKNLHFGWDFYTKHGERITCENFMFAVIIGNFVKVYKKNFRYHFGWGLYNLEGKKLVSAEWNDLLIVSGKITNKPKYIIVKDYRGYSAICNIDGSFVMNPQKLLSIECVEEDSVEYIEVMDNSGKELIYEFAEEGIVRFA